MNLVAEFERIRRHHDVACRRTAARCILSPSVMRVYRAGTKDSLFPVVAGLPVHEICELRSEGEFKLWFERNLDLLAEEIKRTNPRNKKIFPGYKWGHATKILCLYLREALISRRLASDAQLKSIEPWLFSPIDSIVIERLRECGCDPPFGAIREIDSAEKFYAVQDELAKAAAQVGVPKIWFDDNWGDRQGRRT